MKKQIMFLAALLSMFMANQAFAQQSRKSDNMEHKPGAANYNNNRNTYQGDRRDADHYRHEGRYEHRNGVREVRYDGKERGHYKYGKAKCEKCNHREGKDYYKMERNGQQRGQHDFKYGRGSERTRQIR